MNLCRRAARGARLCLLLLVAGLTCCAQPAPTPVLPPDASPLLTSAAPGITADAIVQLLAEHNRLRETELKGYTDRRSYTVTYRGFHAVLSATMVVEATYDAPFTKQFHIVSESGSKLLEIHVLRKLLAAEQQAARDPGGAALTPANYAFTLLGMTQAGGRPCYVLQAEPKTRSPLLFRGQVFVDAQDYAVARIEAEPARNPSFWIRNTRIHHVYARTGPFWLPQSNESVTEVRPSGSAVLTIDYGAYQTQTADDRADSRAKAE
jgi:hypothetical protein